MRGLRAFATVAALGAALGGCASIGSPFDSALPSAKLRVLELGSVQLTDEPGVNRPRVLEKQPWQWRGNKALGSPMQSFIPPLFLGGDDALILTLGGGIGLYDLRTGAPKWMRPLAIGAAAWPHVADNHVYVAGMDHRLRKLRLDNGQEAWNIETSAESTGGVTASHSFVYVSTDDASLSAYDQKTGKSQWTYKRPAPSGVAYWALRGSGYPLLNAGGERIYIGFADGIFVCLEASTGQTIWERNFERAGLFQDADQRAQLSKDGSLVYVPLVDGDLVVLKTSDGGTGFKVPNAGGASPYIDEDESAMYVTLNTGAVQKVELRTSKVLWTRDLGAGFVGSPVGVGPLAVAALSSTEGLKILDRASGELIYERMIGPGALATPAFDGRRLLLISARNELVQLRVEPRGSEKNPVEKSIEKAVDKPADKTSATLPAKARKPDGVIDDVAVSR